MSRTLKLQHYHPDAGVVRLDSWDASVCVLRQILHEETRDHIEYGQSLVSDLQREGVLQFVANHLLSGSDEIGPDIRSQIKSELLRSEAEKLSDDRELALIIASASELGLPILIIKGEALARSVYPLAGCRPTGDYDLLIRPSDLAAFQNMFSKLGYRSSHFAGTYMFGEQAWFCQAEHRGRLYLVDLHWDITNRRFFRRRVGFDELWRASVEISVDDATGKIPCEAHNLMIACVHLGAAPVTEPLYLRWLLDIYLLLEALSQEEFGRLIEQAGAWGLQDVIAVYCKATDDVLGPVARRDIIHQLHADMSGPGRRKYARCSEHRVIDLVEFGLRLNGWRERKAYIAEAIAYGKKWRSIRR